RNIPEGAPKKHDNKPLFWPYLATCHYSNETKEWHTVNSFDYGPREFNPPNSPELWPIEQHWSIVMRTLRKTPEMAQTIKQFRSKWT
ncbi:hypothetical protein ILUMI_16700, partial [Ignelater luminosus]